MMPGRGKVASLHVRVRCIFSSCKSRLLETNYIPFNKFLAYSPFFDRPLAQKPKYFVNVDLSTHG